MSRIGKTPITVPAGVDVKLTPGHISIKGPKGSLERVIPGNVGGTVVVVRGDANNRKITDPDDLEWARLQVAEEADR